MDEKRTYLKLVCFAEDGFVVRSTLMQMMSLYGICGPKRGRIQTLSRISLRVRGNRFITVVKRSNSKGSAFVGVLNYLSIPASKGCCLGKASMSAVGSGSLSIMQGGRVNFVFRNFGLVTGLATLRGIRLPLVCHKVSQGAEEGLTIRSLGGIKLRGHVSRGPGRVSKKRRRHITVTETVTTEPPIVLTSRPAKGLSSTSDERVVRVLGKVRESKRALVLVARSGKVTTRTGQIIQVVSKGVRSSVVGRRFIRRTWR